MPSKSKSQFRFMKWLSSKKKTDGKSKMSPEKAEEYTSENVGEKSYENLPEKTSKRKFKVLRKKG